MLVLQSIILSLVQGITEFLPISSSGHLILIPTFFDWPDQGLAFDAVVHLGTSLAVIVYFFSDLKRLVQEFWQKKEPQTVVWALAISTIPAIIAGFFLRDFIANDARTFKVVMYSLILWGIVLILAEYYAKQQKEKIAFSDISIKQGLIIGIAQAFALIPGTSRSGITLAAGYFLNLKRKDAIKFSFLMGLPVILGAGLLSFADLYQANNGDVAYLPIFIGLIGSFLSGLVAIHLLDRVIEKNALYFFGAYRIVLAIIIVSIL